jgi:hypothetical protein
VAADELEKSDDTVAEVKSLIDQMEKLDQLEPNQSQEEDDGAKFLIEKIERVGQSQQNQSQEDDLEPIAEEVIEATVNDDSE